MTAVQSGQNPSLKLHGVAAETHGKDMDMATIIIASLVAAALALAVRQLAKDKKAGKPLCGGKCSSCPNGCMCHGGDSK